ncbi:MAG TPA: hypothetical protein ENN61_02015, partial [Bacteroidaceae bacterium]|nr:hypothetical protein [Bacteroidaceae bacterium]
MRFSWYYLLLITAIVLIGGYSVISRLNKPRQQALEMPAKPESPVEIQAAQSGLSREELLIGDVIIKDFYGGEIVRTASAVMNGNWIALPVGMMIGGNSILFQRKEEGFITVDKVFWLENDPVILCRFSEEQVSGSMKLNPWKLSSPLEWRPLLRNNSFYLEVISFRNRGSFSSFRLPADLNEPGVFIQNKRIVGWTFGEGWEEGFLWTGASGANLIENLDVDQFYFLVLSDSRETQLMTAVRLEDTDVSLSERLDAYAESFRLQSKLPVEDLPSTLDLRFVLDQMHVHALELIENGFAGDVIRI